MPVLDANALKNDPKGMAFLSSVLRQTSPARAPFEKPSDTGHKSGPVAKLRVWRLGLATAL